MEVSKREWEYNREEREQYGTNQGSRRNFKFRKKMGRERNNKKKRRKEKGEEESRKEGREEAEGGGKMRKEGMRNER